MADELLCSYDRIAALIANTNFGLQEDLDESGAAGIWDLAGELIHLAESEEDGQDVLYSAIREILKLERAQALPVGTEGYCQYKKILLNDVSPIGVMIQASGTISSLANRLLAENEVLETKSILDEKTALFQTGSHCPRCGEPLYLSDLPNYEAVCYNCDENFDIVGEEN